jgi:NAD(P)-dependent dehydrogenase (short-subunit alcohol dehydrogenase family)
MHCSDYFACVLSSSILRFSAGDIRDYEAVESFVAATLKHFGKITTLINCAGGQFLSPALAISAKGFAAVVNNNLMGTFNFCKAVCTEAFIPSGTGGRIVNVVAQTKRGFPGMVHTGAARAGVENLTMTLSVEWAPFGVRLNAVAPGFIATPITKTKYPAYAQQRAKDVSLVQRHGDPMEVARLIAFLASPKTGGFITGQTYYIDGGQSIYGDLFDPFDALKSKL